MDQISHDELSIEILNARFDLSGFDSGDSPEDDELDNFLKKDALKEQQLLLSRTHLCFYKDHVAGFISLAADSVRLDKLDRAQHIDGIEYPAYPCILIARLAVDKRLHGRGIGKFLLLLAIGLALDGPLGCRYLSVDPKEKAIDYYKKFGFNYWVKNKRRMYLNMEDVAKQSRQEESLDFWSISE